MFNIDFANTINNAIFYGLVFVLFLVVAAFLAATVLYVIDRTQYKHTIRHNYPLIGRFRYLLEYLGYFMRQYFFSMDREEMPFNRAQRSWVYQASKNMDSTVAFGSTKDLRQTGTVFFVNCPYPTLRQEASTTEPIMIGDYCKKPYVAKSLFNISGMSFGAISRPAVLALSQGAKIAECWMNTGEGGLSPYHLQGGADIVFQIGTAKNGMRTLDGELDEGKLKKIASEEQVKMFELKLSQGAKPGKGGLLPGAKVTEEIARIRNIRPGEDAVSPNRHIEINNNDDLLDMIERIRNITGKPVGIKCVIGAYGWLDNLFKAIHERGIESAPDFITVDSADGGTGAAPMSLMDSMGLPLRESLPLLVDKLIEYRLRERVKVIASGKLITPADLAFVLCVGTDFVTSARGFMFALGCIQALQCNKNTCPTGITTHNKKLQGGLSPQLKANRVANYVAAMNHEVGIIAHSCGVKEARELKRFHARVVVQDGLSISLADRYPESKAREL